MDASRIETKKSITVSYMCRDDKGKTHYSIDKSIGNVLVWIKEAIAICETVKKAIQLKIDNLIMKSNL